MGSLLQKLSIKQRIYLMLAGGLFYSMFIVAISQYQSYKTSENFRSIQENQLRFIMMADSIKSKLSKIQNLQVRQIVDSIILHETDTTALDILLPEVMQDLKELGEYARNTGDEELIQLSKNLNLRYGLVVATGAELDYELIQEDAEEGFMAIETLIAVADKMVEELSLLISMSHENLNGAIADFKQQMKERDRTLVLVGIASMLLFLLIGVFFIKNLMSKIRALTKGTTEFSGNNFAYRIRELDEGCHDELCSLADSFNMMAGSIEELVEEQQRTNEILDERVKEKTAELQKSLDELERTNMIVMDSINYASKIQHSFLPDEQKMQKIMDEHFVIWNQRDVVGGDFYWMEEVEEGHIIALIDCTGHGVPGALMTMIAIPTLERIVKEHGLREPALIMEALNKTLKQMLKKSDNELGDDGLDAGICYVDNSNRKLYFSGAGIPLFYTHNEGVELIRGEKKGIGYADTDYNHTFKEHTIQLASDMTFYMATDGITEQVGGEKRRMMFGKKRLKKLIEEIHQDSTNRQKHIILETLNRYRGKEPQKDDMTCISFKIAA